MEFLSVIIYFLLIIYICQMTFLATFLLSYALFTLHFFFVNFYCVDVIEKIEYFYIYIYGGGEQILNSANYLITFCCCLGLHLV